MRRNEKMKVFIAYSHEDNGDKEDGCVSKFKKHMAVLKKNGYVDEWYDREILGGQDYQFEIDNNLEEADIICLCISENFLSSGSCLKEIKRSLELQNEYGIRVIPIIITRCMWTDDEEINHLLALPTDGKPISTFDDPNEGWLDVCNGLKRVIEHERKIRQLKIVN